MNAIILPPVDSNPLEAARTFFDSAPAKKENTESQCDKNAEKDTGRENV